MIIPDRPEPQVLGNKLDPEDTKSNCGIKEILTHLYNEAKQLRVDLN
jgi:hypothetical protein